MRFLLPTSDTTVLWQFISVTVIGITATFLARRNRDLVIFFAGATILTLALFGVRAVH